jgi:general secretion pathway protein A
MYETAFRLRRKTFQLSADPEFLYMTPQHSEALTGLVYALLSHKGLVVITGDAGTGKTTLLAKALRQLPIERLQTSVILNPCLSPDEFLELMLLDFGVPSIPESKAQRVWLLQELLLKTHAEGRIGALIVDEAHKLTPEVLEEIRLLGNFELSDQKLLQIVLIGQPELADTLNRPDLRQFKQRIAVRLNLQPLSSWEVREYIAHRWKQGGGETPPFDAEAIEAIAGWSGGICRVINAICDNALLSAYGEGVHEVQVRHVRAAAKDLDLFALIGGLDVMPDSARKRPPDPAPRPIEEPAPAPTHSAPRADEFRTLSFAGAGSVKPSLFGRWAGRLGLSHEGGKL